MLATVTPAADTSVMADIPHGTSSGYNYWKCRCDVCVSAKSTRDRAYYERTKPPLLPKRVAKYATPSARTRAWKLANPERTKANDKRSRDHRRAEINAKNLARYHELMASNPDLVREKQRAASKTDKAKLANRAKRYRRRGARATPEALDYMTILVADPCSYCGWPGGEVDHITPISAGGDGDWSNLTGACRGCNARKNDRSLMSFLTERVA